MQTFTQKPQVGQQVFVVIPKRYPHGAPPETKYAPVAKVGRKYLHVNTGYWRHEQFYIDDGWEKSETTAECRVWESEELWKADRDKAAWRQAFDKEFGYPRRTRHTDSASVTVEDFEKAAKILGIPAPDLDKGEAL